MALLICLFSEIKQEKTVIQFMYVKDHGEKYLQILIKENQKKYSQVHDIKFITIIVQNIRNATTWDATDDHEQERRL